MERIINIENVTKIYNGRKVLNDITIEFNKGNIYGLVGRNGCGKTLLMKLICKFITPDYGKVTYNENYIKIKDHMPTGIGIIIETPGFIGRLSGFQNLKFLAGINNEIDDKEIIDYLKEIDLFDVKDKKVNKYSLGMKQRLGIIQALMENPQVLILDEPMNGLDNSGVQKVRELLLKKNHEGKTIILSSHNKEDIEALCNIVIEMDDGKIVNIQKF